MTLYSPTEDFLHRTVAHLPSVWAKLEYLASLRMEEGVYEHWGLARVFGQEPAQKAIEQTHRQLVLQLLRTPLSMLVDEAKSAADRQGVPLNVYLDTLYSQGAHLLPTKLGGGSAKHFNSVLLALSALAACPRPNTVATLRVS